MSQENVNNRRTALLIQLINEFYLSHEVSNQSIRLHFTPASEKLIKTLTKQQENCCSNYQFTHHTKEEGIHIITINVENINDWDDLYSKVLAQIKKTSQQSTLNCRSSDLI